MHDARSHTDTLTNVVVLSSLDVRRHFPDIVGRDLPIATLPTFLHEATHHWCLDTPVGIALHLLFMRARRAAFTVATAKDPGDSGWSVFDSVVRYELARDFMRPISEGMALFAEHDAIPGAARTISTPLTLMSGLYGRGYGVLGDDPYHGLPVVLAAARLSRAHVRRKAALFLEPLTCDKGGYLPGYLVVKNLWRLACQRNDLFFDADYFLQYLRAYLFEDWALVAHLLDDSTKDIGALDPIMERMAKRIAEFLTAGVQGDRPARFEEMCLNTEPKFVEVRTDVVAINLRFWPIDDEAEIALGRTRLKDAIAEYFPGWSGDDQSDALLAQDRAEFNQRSFINLGHATVDGVAIPDGLRLTFDDGLSTDVPAKWLMEHEDLAGPVELDFLSLNSLGGLCVLLTRDNRVLACVPLGKSELPEALTRTSLNRENRTLRISLTQELIDVALDSISAHEHLAVVRRQILARLNDWFVETSLVEIDEADRPRVRETMQTRGLFNVLEKDLGLVLDAAALSLCLPSPFGFGAVDSFHTWSTGSPEASFQRINDLVAPEIGIYPFLKRDGKFVRASFI